MATKSQVNIYPTPAELLQIKNQYPQAFAPGNGSQPQLSAGPCDLQEIEVLWANPAALGGASSDINQHEVEIFKVPDDSYFLLVNGWVFPIAAGLSADIIFVTKQQQANVTGTALGGGFVFFNGLVLIGLSGATLATSAFVFNTRNIYVPPGASIRFIIYGASAISANQVAAHLWGYLIPKCNCPLPFDMI